MGNSLAMNNKIAPVLIPLPNQDFDPTEASISWKIITDAGYEVVFATEHGDRAYADELMITGQGLDFWGFIPGLKKITLVGKLLRANKNARQAYQQMQQDPSFLQPLKFDQLQADDYAGIVLPGGHAPGMRQYLEDETLRTFVADFFDQLSTDGQHRPVGAICHGVLLAARAKSKATGKSSLWGRKTTALTWQQEHAAEKLSRVIRFWDPLYYRTYSESPDEAHGFWSVESEVKRALKEDSDFLTVAADVDHYKIKTANIKRDTEDDSRPAWVVKDGNYVSARWPGDAHTFAKAFVELLGSE